MPLCFHLCSLPRVKHSAFQFFNYLTPHFSLHQILQEPNLPTGIKHSVKNSGWVRKASPAYNTSFMSSKDLAMRSWNPAKFLQHRTILLLSCMCLWAAMTRIIKEHTAQICEQEFKLCLNIHAPCQSQKQVSFGKPEYCQPQFFASSISYIIVIKNRSWHYFHTHTHKQVIMYPVNRKMKRMGWRKADRDNDTNTDLEYTLTSSAVWLPLQFTHVNQLKLHRANRLHFPPVNTGYWFHCQ